MQEYILIAQDDFLVEQYLRQDGERWLYTKTTGLAETIKLPAIGCEADLRDIYAKVTQ